MISLPSGTHIWIAAALCRQRFELGVFFLGQLRPHRPRPPPFAHTPILQVTGGYPFRSSAAPAPG
jgi:hypothetical protein